MKDQHGSFPHSDRLRKRAEELLNKRPVSQDDSHSDTNDLRMIHEIEVHQVELELQNEELSATIGQLRDAVQFYDFAPTGFFTLSKEGEIINLNLCGAQMLGENRSDLMNCLFGIFVTDHTKPIFNLFLNNVFNSQIRESCEVTLRANDQQPMLVHLSGIVSDNGKQCLITALDIKELKITEQALKESEAKYRELVENSPDAIVIYADGKIVLINKQGLQLMAATNADQMIGKPVIEFVHPDFRKLVAGRMKKVTTEGTVLPIVEEKFMRLDGSVVDVEVKSMSIRLENKPAVQLIIRDITERKLAEEKLRKSETSYRMMFENSLTGIFMTHPDGAIFSANSEACRLLNRTEEEIFRIGYKGVVEMNHDFLKAIKERKQTGCFHGELNFVHANGTVFPAEVESCFYTDPKGKLHSYIFFQDISERKRTESEIKIKNNELSRLLDEKDKFFSILAHDLRNPFNAFLGFTQLLSEDLPNMSLPEIQKIALILKNTATNVYGLLENLLEWSKIQRGISDFNPKSFLLRTKIDGSLPLVIESANKKEIKIGFDIPDDMMVTADPNMFDSIVRNLTTNAVKFTPKGRKITLSAKPAPNNFVEISVRDNGIGMEKDLCSKLFSLDKHTGHKGTEGESSSGLGLSICKDFVEKHHGSIWAESEKGKGSTFYFTLPGGI